MRIASYNIRKARGLDQRKNQHRVLNVINHLDADVVVLQEADHRFGRRKPALSRQLIERNTDHLVVALNAESESLGWHGNAILVRPAIKVGQHWCQTLPGLESRGAVYLDLIGATDIRLVATHLGLRRRDRLAQQKAICGDLSNAQPTVVAGDFNEWSLARGFEPFGNHLTLHIPGKSFPAAFAMAPLDRFAVSTGIRVEATGVMDRPPARFASDHLPIWCDFSVRTPCGASV